MRFRKKELRKLLGGDTHTNSITKHCVSIYDACLVFPPWNILGWTWQCCNGQETGEGGSPFQAEKETVLRMEGAGGAVQRLAWSEQAEKLSSFQRKRRWIRAVHDSFLILLPWSDVLGSQTAVAKLNLLSTTSSPSFSPSPTSAAASPTPQEGKCLLSDTETCE